MRGNRLLTFAISMIILGCVAPAYVSAQEETPTSTASQTAGDDALHEFNLCERLKAQKSILWGQAPGVIYSDDTRITGRIQPGDYIRILTTNNREDGTVRVQVLPSDDRTVGRSGGRVWIDWASLVRSNTEHLMFECESTSVFTGEVDQMDEKNDVSVTFQVRSENVSADSDLPTPLAPGIWVLHSGAGPLFTSGEADRGYGLEALAEAGNPTILIDALKEMDLHADVFNTPAGADGPGPLLPGGAYEFEVQATPDTPNISFATMFVQSNDLFLAPDGRGIALFDKGGTALEVHDATSYLLLWDAGTEANEEPGSGPNQAPRQSAANIGPADGMAPVRPVDDEFSYPDVAALVKVSIKPILATEYPSAQESTTTATPTVRPELPLAAIPDGTWLVGQEVSAGIYTASGGEQCSWKRLSGFGGTSDDVIARAFGAVRPIVEIAPTDRGFMTSNCGQWTLISMPSTPTPAASLTPTSTSTPAAMLSPTTSPTPTALPVPLPTVEVPKGWKRIEDDRLGYSLAVPFQWVTFDLQSDHLDPIAGMLAGMLGGKEAVDILRGLLKSPYTSNIGVLAIEPDVSQVFARPPFPMFLNVSKSPKFDKVTGDQLIAYIKRTVEALDDVQLHSIRTGAVNGLPALQAVVTAYLGESMGIELTPHLVITVIHANQKAYLLIIATRSNKAEAKRELINQIVETFLPEIGVPQATPTTKPTTAPTPTPMPTATVRPTATPKGRGGEKLGTHIVGVDIAPCIYTGIVPRDEFACQWERLSSLAGDRDSVLGRGIGFGPGQYFLQVLDSDYAVRLDCPVVAFFATEVDNQKEDEDLKLGTLFVGKDVAPGLYKGVVPKEENVGCLWERLANFRGENDSSLESDLVEAGQYYVEVLPSDYAVTFSCPVEKVR